ncbi:MAG: hypothetical protein R3318_03090 [Gammaproteobacteria bacterium]|nr:hypothetical protein [Gammaproteobacteria bacterium]
MDNINWQLVTIIIAVSSLLIGLTRLWISYRQHLTFKKNISPGVRAQQKDMIQCIRNTISKANRETYLSLEDLQEFKQGTKDHALLFDTRQRKFIKELNQQVQALHRISVPLQTKTLTKDKWDEYSRKHMELLHWFEGQLEISDEVFKAYVEE